MFTVSAGALVIQPSPTPGTVSPVWTSINDCAYEQRGEFFAGLSQMEATVDRQITDLTAKHAAMPTEAKTISYTDWDLAVKELTNASSYLHAADAEAHEATPDTWNQEKEKVGEAWTRTQDGCTQAMFALQE